LSVLCVRGPQEEKHFEDFEARFAGDSGVLHWRERADLRRLAALLEVLRDSGATFVGPDSGPIHLAAACGLRALCLTGPQAHQRTGPQPGRSLRRADGPACAPCLQRECTHDSGPICMQISPQEVLAALEESQR
jgi:ADP-heptose:LPS heptosyltransferase